MRAVKRISTRLFVTLSLSLLCFVCGVISLEKAKNLEDNFIPVKAVIVHKKSEVVGIVNSMHGPNALVVKESDAVQYQVNGHRYEGTPLFYSDGRLARPGTRTTIYYNKQDPACFAMSVDDLYKPSKTFFLLSVLILGLYYLVRHKRIFIRL
jgi:hypothetical protein